MFNFLKKKELELEFIVNTSYAYAYEYFPVKRSSRFIPNWYKNTPKSEKINYPFSDAHPEYFAKKTARGCIGIQNMLTTGVVIPWWSELQISTMNGDYRFAFSDKRSTINWHDNVQAPGFFEEYTILKIQCPWLLRSSQAIKFMLVPYFYADQQQDIVFMPAIGETFTKYNICNLHFFMAIKKSTDVKTYNFNPNTPALQLIPLTESDYSIKNSILSHEDFDSLYNIVNTDAVAVNSGLFSRKLSRKISKCPFHNKD